MRQKRLPPPITALRLPQTTVHSLWENRLSKDKDYLKAMFYLDHARRLDIVVTRLSRST